jgi:hypothetical protein
MDALVPPLKQAEEAISPPKQAKEAETQEEAEMPLLTRDGKEEKEEMEEKEGEREKWKEKKESNLWDSIDALALRAILENQTREYIAKSCYAKMHLDGRRRAAEPPSW